MVQVQCPKCGRTVNAAEEVLGKRVSCGVCQHVFIAVASSHVGGSWPGGPAAPMPPGDRPSGQATASLVLGIISIPTCILYGIPSLVCGILAVVFGSAAAKSVYPARLSSSAEGMAKAGKICGWVGIALSIAFWVLLIILVASVTSTRRRMYGF